SSTASSSHSPPRAPTSPTPRPARTSAAPSPRWRGTPCGAPTTTRCSTSRTVRSSRDRPGIPSTRRSWSRAAGRSASPGSAPVGAGVGDLVPLQAELVGGTQRPPGLAQGGAADEDDVGTLLPEDLLGLFGLGDHPDGGRRDACLPTDGLREGDLEAGAGGDLRHGCTTGGDVDEVDAGVAKQCSETHGLP